MIHYLSKSYKAIIFYKPCFKFMFFLIWHIILVVNNENGVLQIQPERSNHLIWVAKYIDF